MGRDDRPHREVAGLLAPVAGAAVCDVGCGPGSCWCGLPEATWNFGCAAWIPPRSWWVMVRQARARADRAEVTDRVGLQLGTAAALPLPDGEIDYVVAVNSAAVWPDLTAGLREASRVRRSSVTVLIAWHAGGSPR